MSHGSQVIQTEIWASLTDDRGRPLTRRAHAASERTAAVNSRHSKRAIVYMSQLPLQKTRDLHVVVLLVGTLLFSRRFIEVTYASCDRSPKSLWILESWSLELMIFPLVCIQAGLPTWKRIRIRMQRNRASVSQRVLLAS